MWEIIIPAIGGCIGILACYNPLMDWLDSIIDRIANG